MPSRLATTAAALVAAGVVAAPALATTTAPDAVSHGTITVQDATYVSGPAVHGHPFTLDQVTETPAGSGGAQNMLTTTDDPGSVDPHGGLSVTGWSYVGGEQQFYSAKRDTIYESSIWGPFLHPGTRPGTWVYRDAPGAPTRATRPFVISAAQRQALLRGRAVIAYVPKQVGDKVQIEGPRVIPPFHAQSEEQEVQQGIADHTLTLVGDTTVDGRAAVEYTAANPTPETALDVYLDPSTRVPFEQITDPGTARQEVIRYRLIRTLPITAANERRLSLFALHPHAKIDRSFEDYRRAAHGNTYFPG